MYENKSTVPEDPYSSSCSNHPQNTVHYMFHIASYCTIFITCTVHMYMYTVHCTSSTVHVSGELSSIQIVHLENKAINTIFVHVPYMDMYLSHFSPFWRINHTTGSIHCEWANCVHHIFHSWCNYSYLFVLGWVILVPFSKLKTLMVYRIE